MGFLKNLFGGSPQAATQPLEVRKEQSIQELAGLLNQHFSTTFESHPATLLRGCAWLAGASLFHSFRLPHKAAPGTPVFSDIANQEGPKLLNLYMYTVIEQYKIALDTKQIVYDTPPEYKPKKDIVTVQRLLLHPYNQVMKKYGFDHAVGAQIGAFVCALFTRTYCVERSDLDPRVAAGIVSMGLVEGTKTTPVPLK